MSRETYICVSTITCTGVCTKTYIGVCMCMMLIRPMDVSQPAVFDASMIVTTNSSERGDAGNTPLWKLFCTTVS